MSNYTRPPPAYNAGQSKNYPQTDEATEPLLSSPRAGTSGNAIFDQPTDLPDDFKVR